MFIDKQYDSIAKDYIKAQSVFYSKNPDESRIFIESRLGDLKGKTLLDLGCGAGEDIVKYSDLGAASVYGVDASTAMIDAAKKIVKHPDLLAVKGIEHTGLPDEAFDVVVTRFSLHYLKKLDLAFSEIHRMLKQGGTLIVVVHHPLKDYLNQKQQIYGKQEIITTMLFDNAVPITYPTHTFGDYFSPTFTSLFQLASFYESEVQAGKQAPNTLGFVAIKR